MELYIVNINDINNIDAIYQKLSEDKKVKASKFVHLDDKKRSIIASYLIDKYSGEGALKYNEYKKPYKDNGIYFNVSHSYDYVIIGVAKQNVGVDIEQIREFDSKLADYVFDFKVDNAYDFYFNWTKKESIIKYNGKGVSNKMKEIPIKDNNLFIKSIDYEDYVISVCLKNEEEINLVRLYEL